MKQKYKTYVLIVKGKVSEEKNRAVTAAGTSGAVVRNNSGNCRKQ
jgi:hypothetical protein